MKYNHRETKNFTNYTKDFLCVFCVFPVFPVVLLIRSCLIATFLIFTRKRIYAGISGSDQGFR